MVSSATLLANDDDAADVLDDQLPKNHGLTDGAATATGHVVVEVDPWIY